MDRLRRDGRRWAAGVLVAGALLLPAGIRALQRQREGAAVGVVPARERGRPRSLALARLDGGQWSLADERGHVVALNLWATWCGPCREETPTLERLDRELRGPGFRVVGLSLDEGRGRVEAVRRFAQAYDVRYPLALPEAGSQMGQGLEGLPTTLLFDRSGRLAKMYVGTVTERGFRQDVEQLLAEPAS